MSKKQVTIILCSFAVALLTFVLYAFIFGNGIFNAIQSRINNDAISLEWFIAYKEIAIKVLFAVFGIVSLFQIITLILYLKKKRIVLVIFLVTLLLGLTIFAIIDKQLLNYIFALPAINIILYLYDLKNE